MDQATKLCQSGELHTVKELREIAKSLEIPRYSTLSKAKLCKEIASNLKATIEDVNGNENIALLNGFMDPITQDILYDPYIASDGFSYNKSSLLQLFAGSDHPIGPESKQPLDKKFMLANVNLKKAVLDWLIEVGKETEEEAAVEAPAAAEHKAHASEGNFINGIYWDNQVVQEERQQEQRNGTNLNTWLVTNFADAASFGEVDGEMLPLRELVRAGYVLFIDLLLCEQYLAAHSDIRRRLAGKIVFYASPNFHSMLVEYEIRNRRDEPLKRYSARRLVMTARSNKLVATTGQVYVTAIPIYITRMHASGAQFAKLSEFVA